MQDKDLKHMSRQAQTFFEEQNTNWWHTPPESPDLNPIKDSWHKLKFFLESKVKPSNKQELVDGLKEFWERRIMPEKCTKYIVHILCKAIPAVVEAVVIAIQTLIFSMFRLLEEANIYWY